MPLFTIFFLYIPAILTRWKVKLIFFLLSNIFFYGEGIRSILRPWSISSSPKFSPRYPLFQSLLMIIQNSFDFDCKILFLTHMLIVYIIQILSTTLMSLIGQSHLNLSLLLLQSKSIYGRLTLYDRLKIVYFFITSQFLFDF